MTSLILMSLANDSFFYEYKNRVNCVDKPKTQRKWNIYSLKENL